MLNHQIEFSKAIQEIYKPISGRVSDPNSLIPEGNPEGIRACEEYENIVRDLLATLQPELEMIEQRVIAPADQLLEVIKVVRKVSVKRDHKQLDYDRHRTALKKLQDKKEKTLKDEKALFKAEGDVEQATQDYEYFNNLLKEELPKLFGLEAEFIRPLFQSFYYMQLNVFYTLHEKMQAINIGYFDLTLDIEEAFEAKRGDVKEKAEELSIVHFKATGGVKAPRGVSKYGVKAKEAEAGKSKYARNSSTVSNPEDGIANPPPPYSPATSSPTSPALGALGKAKPPPPKPKPSRLSGVPAAETVTALYDYEAQAEGDLSFMTGDTIEIVTRTQNENEWWIGKVNGRQGQFPGMYSRPSGSDRMSARNVTDPDCVIRKLRTVELETLGVCKLQHHGVLPMLMTIVATERVACLAPLTGDIAVLMIELDLAAPTWKPVQSIVYHSVFWR
jgi:amphiphysin